MRHGPMSQLLVTTRLTIQTLHNSSRRAREAQWGVNSMPWTNSVREGPVEQGSVRTVKEGTAMPSFFMAS